MTEVIEGTAKEVGEACQAVLKFRGEGKTRTLAHVRAELVQVAAVAVAAVEFIDRHPEYEEEAE